LLVYALYVEDRCANLDNLPITIAGITDRHHTDTLSLDHDEAPHCMVTILSVPAASWVAACNSVSLCRTHDTLSLVL
jgi:hypothetical protein